MPSLHDIEDLDLEAWERILSLALEQPAQQRLAGQGVALLFEKPSARTRNSTEMAVVDLGGHPVYIQGTEVGLDTRETAEDVARTLACYHRVICARVFDHALFARMGAALRRSGMDVPLVNLLSDDAHPCQAVADVLTLRECLGPLAGKTLTYVGDANNMARSLAKAALYEGMAVRIAAPAGYSFSSDEMQALQTAGRRGGARRPRRADGRSRSWRSRARPRSTPTCGRAWARRTSGRRAWPPSPASPSTRTWWPWRRPRRSCCTACPRTGARRSATACSRGRRAWCGARPPTGARPCGGSWPGPSVSRVRGAS